MDMRELFQNKSNFNDDISNWDVSNVITMRAMFNNADNFNQNLSNWDVSNVATMRGMFGNADNFNQNLSDWDVSNVTNMNGMFGYNGGFQNGGEPLSWNTSNVTNMEWMFFASNFNQPLVDWDVSNVTKMNQMFYGSQFNHDIGDWDVSSVTTMSRMFIQNNSFNQDISQWDVSSVNDFFEIFNQNNAFNQDISSWDISNASNINNMFGNGGALSSQNKCNIHNSFSQQHNNWTYDWSEFCPTNCVRVITGNDTNNKGTIDIVVYSDNNELLSSLLGGWYDNGEAVLDECFSEQIGNIAVHNPTTDGWVGSMEISYNSGIDYAPLECIDCTGSDSFSTEFLVDGNASHGANTECINGDTCTFIGCEQGWNECGECGSDCLDCAGVYNGDAELDYCGVCDSDFSNNNTTCCSVAFGETCIFIETGTESENNGGTIDVFVEENDETNHAFTDGYYNAGDVVLDECFGNVQNLIVTGPTGDAWAGSVQISFDGGENYNYMLCENCTNSNGGDFFPTTFIAIDGNDNGGNQAGVDCLNGDECTLYPVNGWSGMLEDDCGECGGDDNSGCLDCAGVSNGDAVLDNCNVCDNDATNDCTQDCAGDWGGNAIEDECGVCEGDNSSCSGCNDPNASNYNEDAIVDDGSCCIDLWETCYNIDDTYLLDLVESNLTGEIPSTIGNLTNLTFLNLGGNDLTGEIPSSIGELDSLHHLLLWGNQLTGSIPTEIGNLTSLEVLDLNSNSLSGSIPTEIGNLTSLEFLALYTNSFTGNIPTEIGNLTSLTTLNISGTNLTGEIPESIGDLTSLNHLALWGNQLSGTLPGELGSLTSLNWLDLNNNNFSGSIPSEIGSLTLLTELHLSGNQLTGELPSSLANLTNLNGLNLSYNQLEGAVLSSFCDINELELQGNQFCSTIPDCFNDNIGEQDCIVMGCTDQNSCSYNADANTDDGSCLYYDCNSICGGNAIEDECGVCEGDNYCTGCDLIDLSENPPNLSNGEYEIDTGGLLTTPIEWGFPVINNEAGNSFSKFILRSDWWNKRPKDLEILLNDEVVCSWTHPPLTNPETGNNDLCYSDVNEYVEGNSQLCSSDAKSYSSCDFSQEVSYNDSQNLTLRVLSAYTEYGVLLNDTWVSGEWKIIGSDTDCNGECFGTAIYDECGDCGGDNSDCADCAGIPNGDAVLDNCNVCDNYASNDCTQDCAGNWGGDAQTSTYWYDSDGDGLGAGDSSDFCDAAVESNWVTNGDDVDDSCTSNVHDCLGVCDGTHWESDCGCVAEGNSGDDCLDCAGEPNGGLVYDECGECGGDNSECADCAGVPNGDALEDNCNVCDNDPTNDCVQDCLGTWGGTFETDACGVCGGDNSSCADCFDVPYGNAVEDECGVCDGDGWSCAPKGDVNKDYSVDISDIVIIVNHLLEINFLENQALANADWNENGFVNITDVVNIVQYILGNNLTKGKIPSFINITYNDNSISINTDGKVAGLQLEYHGDLNINQNFLPSDWEIQHNENTILIYSLSGTELINPKLFDFTGDITLLSAVGAGWDGEEIQVQFSELPETYILHPAYPNPFNPIANFQYGLPVETNISIEVYNIAGEFIESLFNGKQLSGTHKIVWDANKYPSGVYFVKMVALDSSINSGQGFIQTQKVVLMK